MKMRCLPAAPSSAGDLCLPLGDWSARAWEVCLLSSDDQVFARELADLLQFDPASALWCAAMVLQREGSLKEVRSLADLACRTAQSRPDILERFARGCASDTQDAAGQVNAPDGPTAARDAVRAVGIAAVARQLAADTDAAGHEAAYAYGMLEAARRCWALPHGGAKPDSAGGPAWGYACELPCAVSQCILEAQRLIDKPPAVREAELDFAAVATWQRTAEERWQWRDITRGDLLGTLAQRLFRAEQLQHRFDETLQAEKVAAVYDLAYGAGHEINNPLTNISVRAQTLLKQEEHPERRRLLASIHTQAYRAHEMIADLMLYARPPKLQCQPLELTALAGAVVTQLSDKARQQQTQLTLVPSPAELIAQADPQQLGVALAALCRNALEALGRGGHIEVRVGSRPANGSQAWAELSVRDDGPGIDPAIADRIFHPFYSGREAGRGLGFGLSKCWRIITSHGGRVLVETWSGNGTTFKIQLPLAA